MAVNIQNRLRAGCVTVSAEFIYRYARDTEEFALYMYTLACMNEGKDFDVEAAGKCLDITSRKVVNGLKRLTEEGLIKAEFEKSTLLSLAVISPDGEDDETAVLEADPAPVPEEHAPSRPTDKAALVSLLGQGENAGREDDIVNILSKSEDFKKYLEALIKLIPQKTSDVPRFELTPEQISALDNDKGFIELKNMAQTVIGKPFSYTDFEKFSQFYYRMKKNVPACREIISYCNDPKNKKKNNMTNIDRLACECMDYGCRSAKEVSAYLIHKDHREIVKNGISGKNNNFFPEHYERYVDKWFVEMKFTEDLVKDACRRSIGKSWPFEYTDAILSSWEANDIRTMEAVEKADKDFKKNQNLQAEISKKYDRNKNNRFNQFETRKRDFNEDAKKLFD